MDDSYDKLKVIWNNQLQLVVTSEQDLFNFHCQIVYLLNEHGIQLRKKDGFSPNITVSIPKSKDNLFVVGVRYTKSNETKTEDHFIFSQGSSIRKCRGKELDKLLPEYKGTHIMQR